MHFLFVCCFERDNGLKQGVVITLLLFSVFINDSELFYKMTQIVV